MNRGANHDAIVALEREAKKLRDAAARIDDAIATLRGTEPAQPPAAVVATNDDGLKGEAPLNIAQRITHITTVNGWSQRELARRAGINVSQVGNILRTLRDGGDCNVETLRKIAVGASVTLPWLLTGASVEAAS